MKTSPVGLFVCLFLPEFSSVKDFSENVEHLSPNIFGEKRKKKGQTSRWACRTRAQNFRVSLKNGANIWTFVRKNEYDALFLQVTWF